MKQLISLFSVLWIVATYASSPTDSVGVSKIGNLFVIIHKVDKGEGFLSISRRYNVTVEAIKSVNPTVKELALGQKIKIPYTPKSQIDSTKIKIEESHANADAKEISATKIHTVAQGETISKIATKYKISTQQLIKWNSIKNNSMVVGQELKVSGVTDIKPYEKWNQPNGSSLKADSPKNIVSTNTRLIEEVGFVEIKTQTTHPTLAIGTFILCVNPETQKQILVKVAAHQPLNSTNIIGLSKEDIEKLELDLQLPITIKYNLP
jgi:LysM repeat protein